MRISNRNLMTVCLVIVLVLLIWAIKNPVSSGNYIANFMTWGLKGITNAITKIPNSL